MSTRDTLIRQMQNQDGAPDEIALTKEAGIEAVMDQQIGSHGLAMLKPKQSSILGSFRLSVRECELNDNTVDDDEEI